MLKTGVIIKTDISHAFKVFCHSPSLDVLSGTASRDYASMIDLSLECSGLKFGDSLGAPCNTS